MKAEKSFVTVYDKDCEEYAVTLMSLVSKDKMICNINRKTEEFKKDMTIVSGEYVLSIGKKASVHLRNNFKDIYSNYGIHIGYCGTRAWISCENFDWDKVSLYDFKKELYSISEELGMNTENIEESVKLSVNNEQKKKALETMLSEKIHTELVSSETSDEIKEALLRAIQDAIITILCPEVTLFNFLHKRKEKRRQQYRFATVLFYYYYLCDFLEIKREGNEETNKEENKKENF